jgi:transcriptional regulator with XRE-family HTH domain
MKRETVLSMSISFKRLWQKFAQSKAYREEFVSSQVKRGIPFQIRSLMKQHNLSQEELAGRAGLSQGVVSRAANPNYGNLTLNTIIRIAAGFDVAFVGKFVGFSELGKWYTELSEQSALVETFEQENRALLGSGAEHKSEQELVQMTSADRYAELLNRAKSKPPQTDEGMLAGAANSAGAMRRSA